MRRVQWNRPGDADRRTNKVQCAVSRLPGNRQEISTCPVRHGEGTVSRTESLEVRIKAGTRDGQRIRLAGKGNAGARGGAPGDLYVIIRIEPHPVFQRDGDNIYLTVPVTASEAALGAKVEVPTIDGRAGRRFLPEPNRARSCGCGKRACHRRRKMVCAGMR